MDPQSHFHFRRQENSFSRLRPEHRNEKKTQLSQHLRCLKTVLVKGIMDFLGFSIKRRIPDHRKETEKDDIRQRNDLLMQP
jgi:hypothetical protein